jgi:hypothetical protein
MLRRSAVLSAVLAAGAVLAAAVPSQAVEWASTSMPWLMLPGGQPIGALPQTVSIPSKAWEYGARSDRLDVFGKTEPTILRLDIKAQTGTVGVVLMGTDGTTILSKETPIKASDGPMQIFFRLRPGAQPSFVILRNYDAEGQAGKVLLQQVQFTREADLTNDELAAIVQRGLH